jgi:hypothetical protein
LVQKGANINITSRDGNNIFDVIIQQYYSDQTLDISHIDEESNLEVINAIKQGEGPALDRMFKRIDTITENGYDLNKGKYSAAYCLLLEIHANRFPEKGLLYLFDKGANTKEIINDNKGNRVPIFVRAFCSQNPLSFYTLFEWAKRIGHNFIFNDYSDLTTTIIVAMESNVELLEKLIEDGADINVGNGILLDIAVRRNKIDMVKYLVENGIIINKSNRTLNEVKDIAKVNRFTEIELYLDTLG